MNSIVPPFTPSCIQIIPQCTVDSTHHSFFFDRQINFSTLDGLQYLASLILRLLALGTVTTIGIGAIPMQLLTFPAAVAECHAASATLARIALKSGATSTARISDLAELGSDFISTFLPLRPNTRFLYLIARFRLTSNRQPQFAQSIVLGEEVTVACAKG